VFGRGRLRGKGSDQADKQAQGDEALVAHGEILAD
jgi:hypothetical protein